METPPYNVSPGTHQTNDLGSTTPERECDKDLYNALLDKLGWNVLFSRADNINIGGIIIGTLDTIVIEGVEYKGFSMVSGSKTYTIPIDSTITHLSVTNNQGESLTLR